MFVTSAWINFSWAKEFVKQYLLLLEELNEVGPKPQNNPQHLQWFPVLFQIYISLIEVPLIRGKLLCPCKGKLQGLSHIRKSHIAWTSCGHDFYTAQWKKPLNPIFTTLSMPFKWEKKPLPFHECSIKPTSYYYCWVGLIVDTKIFHTTIHIYIYSYS